MTVEAWKRFSVFYTPQLELKVEILSEEIDLKKYAVEHLNWGETERLKRRWKKGTQGHGELNMQVKALLLKCLLLTLIIRT